MACMVTDNTVSTNEAIAIIAENLQLLSVVFTHWEWVFLQPDHLGPALLQLVKGHDVVTSEYLHLSVRSHAFAADELSALAAERFGLRSRTHFANGFHVSVRFRHLRTEFFHSVDEKRRGQLIGVILMQNSFPSALGTRKGAVGPCLTDQLSDALLAVVVEAREDLGVAEALLTNRAGDLLLQLLQTILQNVRGFRHRNLCQTTGKFSFVFIAGELSCCGLCAAHAHYRCTRAHVQLRKQRLGALPSNSDYKHSVSPVLFGSGMGCNL